MEYSLTCPATAHSWYTMCLNPYSNGILTDSYYDRNDYLQHSCLNPYSNGILTDNINRVWNLTKKRVLILILMEYSQTS